MRLILLTRPTFFVEEDKILSALFERGLDSLHLYKPDTEPIYSERLLSLLPEQILKKTIVHNHYYLKDEFNLAGIHIDKPETGTPQHYKGKVGMTCRSISDIKAIRKKSDYIFLRNIFDSVSNPTEKITFSYNQLHDAAKQGLIDRKVYAQGGLSLENVKIARELGFGGVVICGDIWNRFDIHHEQDFKALLSHFEKLKKAVE
ncbi:MAG: thiamine phosphate synthase [Prevotella sp.]|jgi:thiamine-phosphate pyrophosphorylase|nr:thiamine phosphate synthase [Prevotella sp.]